MSDAAMVARMPADARPLVVLAIALRDLRGSLGRSLVPGCGEDDADDAGAMLKTLDRLGWELRPRSEPGPAALRAQIAALAEQSANEGTVVLFAMGVRAVPWWLPVRKMRAVLLMERALRWFDGSAGR